MQAFDAGNVKRAVAISSQLGIPGRFGPPWKSRCRAITLLHTSLVLGPKMVIPRHVANN